MFIKEIQLENFGPIEPVLYQEGDLFPYGENPTIELKEIKGNRKNILGCRQ